MSRRLPAVIALLLAHLFAIVTPAAGRVIYVNVNATGSDDGTSWEDAYVHLQDALPQAVAGDEVWVAQGVYKPTHGTDRTACRQTEWDKVNFNLMDTSRVF